MPVYPFADHVGHTLDVRPPRESPTYYCQHCRRGVEATPESDLHPRIRDESKCPRHGDTPPCRGCAADRKQAREPRQAPLADPDRIQRGVALAQAAASQAKNSSEEN